MRNRKLFKAAESQAKPAVAAGSGPKPVAE
jgi:hypothetical protein